MSRVDLFNGVEFTIESTMVSFHTYEDWGLYVTNTDCIGEPKQATRYVEVPGRDGLIDLSEAISGRPIYTGREIKIALSGTRDKTNWDAAISAFRNDINGRVCRIKFDNDPSYFWRGRIDIKDFKSALDLGSFIVDIPNAEPYKYDLLSSAEPWLWDPFNFETGIINQTGAEEIVGSGSVTIPRGHMLTCPQFVVSNMVSGTFTVTHDGTTYPLTSGTTVIPAIMVGGERNVTLTFTGTATVQVVYRGGSL